MLSGRTTLNTKGGVTICKMRCWSSIMSRRLLFLRFNTNK